MRRAAMVVALLLGAGVARGDAPGDPPPADAPELEQQFERAVEAFVAHRFADAACDFAAVAEGSREPARQLAALRMAREAQVRIIRAPAARAAARSHDGRYGLLIGTSVTGLSLFGPTLIELADATGKSAIGLYMIGAGASFLAPYLLTRDEPVTWAMTDAYWYGATRGALVGFFALGLGHDPANSFGAKSTLGALSLGSLAMGVGFTLWARDTDASAGLTNMIGKGGDFGMGLALGATSLVLADHDLTVRWASVSGLAGAAVGMGAGWYYGTLRDSTWGDGEVMRAAGIVGAYAAIVPVILASDTTNLQLYTALAIGGGLGGLVVGDRLLVGHHFSAGQGIVTELSTAALAGAGAGLGYLISPSNDSHAEQKIVATGAIVGAVAGFALAYLGLDTDAHADPVAPAMSLHLAPDLAPGRRGLVLAGTF